MLSDVFCLHKSTTVTTQLCQHFGPRYYVKGNPAFHCSSQRKLQEHSACDRAYSASAHQAQTETTEIALGLRDQPTALAPARWFILTVTKSYRINKCSQDFLRNDITQKQYKFRLRWRTPRRYSMNGDCLYTSGQEDLLSNMPGINRYYKILQVGMQRAGLESIRQRVMSYDAAVHCISWYSTHLVIIQYRALRIFLQTFVHMCTTMYYIHILSISMISIYIYM